MLDIHLQQNNTPSLSHSLPLLLLLTHTNNSKSRVCPFSSKASFQSPLGNLCRDRCVLFLSIVHSTPHICKAWHHHPHNSTHLHHTPNLRQSQFPLNMHKHKQQKNNNATLKKRSSNLLPKSSSFHNLPSPAIITLDYNLPFWPK